MFARPVAREIERFILQEPWEFPSDKDRPEYDRAESAVWRKVIVSDQDLNGLGCAKEAEDRAKGKLREYRGSISSTAGIVRSKKTTRGHTFSVSEFPKEGNWHLHIKVEIPAGLGYGKADKQDARALMNEAFSPLLPHTCQHAA